jgi:hypothetical protein
MLLNDLLKQDDSRKVVENARFVEFSKRTVRFGDELYQLRNVTGLEVGELPKGKFPLIPVLVMFVAGLALIAVGIGLIPLGIAGWMTFSHFSQSQKYGLILSLNSGQSTSFVSKDKKFLGNIVSALCKLMEGDIDGVTINFQDRSVNVHGSVKGNISAGDGTHNSYQNQFSE